MKTAQKGFTLIELMIVVAIIGILAAIAIPSYQDYIRRSQATEIVNGISAAKASLEEYWTANLSLPSNTTQGGIVRSLNGSGSFYAGGTFSTSGNSTMILTGRGSVQGSQSVTIRITGTGASDGSVDWACTSIKGTSFLPASCR